MAVKQYKQRDRMDEIPPGRCLGTLKKYNQNEALIKHALAVEAVMAQLAKNTAKIRRSGVWWDLYMMLTTKISR